ncbi:MAG: hypothetical protein JXR94_13830 [Candidatus Hydrogenedentes bacterium]|nr:hypothetical protein [Candidatus Hydrogenedentota bacterium]
MITSAQLEKARDFILRHGDLLTRRRFACHFENAPKHAVLDVLACYQNPDGGFGHGLELDLLCPDSSGICTEMAFGHFVELDVHDGPLFDRALAWVLAKRTPSGDLPHPVEAIKRYPHGGWWEKQDSGRILSIAGLLGRLGMHHPAVTERAAAVFEQAFLPLPDELPVYSYPLNLYLEYADGAGRYTGHRDRLRAAVPAMLESAAWHHPLFFCHGHWASPYIPRPGGRARPPGPSPASRTTAAPS